jgi:hypothetical protein
MKPPFPPSPPNPPAPPVAAEDEPPAANAEPPNPASPPCPPVEVFPPVLALVVTELETFDVFPFVITNVAADAYDETSASEITPKVPKIFFCEYFFMIFNFNFNLLTLLIL